MFTLPYVQEIFQYMIMANPDLCNAGDLRDPVNQKLMKKGLSIATTSKAMLDALDPLKCTGDHEHQIIEGSTFAHGHTISRSTFSELYPSRLPDLLQRSC